MPKKGATGRHYQGQGDPCSPENFEKFAKNAFAIQHLLHYSTVTSFYNFKPMSILIVHAIADLIYK
jgi:hypothetical protein